MTAQLWCNYFQNAEFLCHNIQWHSKWQPNKLLLNLHIHFVFLNSVSKITSWKWKVKLHRRFIFVAKANTKCISKKLEIERLSRRILVFRSRFMTSLYAFCDEQSKLCMYKFTTFPWKFNFTPASIVDFSFLSRSEKITSEFFIKNSFVSKNFHHE